MKIASLAEVKTRFSSYVKASEEGPVIVTRNGKPVAALVALDEEEDIERLVLAYTPKFRAILEASRKQVEAGEAIGHADFWEQVEGESMQERPRGKRTRVA